MNPFPREGRIAAVDYGQVRVGLAITDAAQSISSPYENYQRRNTDDDAAYFREFVVEEQVVGLVVGLPVHPSGDESEKSKEARRYGDWLADVTGVPVRFYDERYSSAAAERFLAIGGLTSKQRKKRRDMLAAQIILSAYLESPRTGEESTDSLE